MAASLDITGNASGAAKALDEVEKGVKDVASETKKAEQASEEWLQELIRDVEKATAAKDQLAEPSGWRSLASNLGESAKGAGDLRDALDGNIGKLAGLARTAGPIAAIAAGFAAAAGAVKGFSALVTTAAENGDQEAQRLVKSVASIGEAWSGLTTRITSTDTFRWLLGTVQAATEGIRETIAVVGELTNVFGDSTDAYVEQQERIKAAGEAQAAVNRQLAEADKVQADLQKSRDAERLQNAVNRITNQGQINALVQKEIELLKQLAAEGKLTAEQQEKSRQKIGTLEARRRQIQAEAVAERKRQIEEQIRAEERAAKEIYDAQVKAAEDFAKEQERLAKEEEKRKEQEVRDAEAAERAKLDAADKAARERQARIDALSKEKGVQDTSTQIREQAGSQQAIINRLASNAGEKGSDEYRKAYRQATMQARGGAKVFSDEEIAQAQQQNADAITNSLEKSGKVSSEVVDALKQVGGTIQGFNQEQAQLSQDVAVIKQFLGDVDKSVKTRAQRMGGKQI